jgi:ParB-like chromosome segregation protein Spo0J
MRGAAFEELVTDIGQNGLREPILCDAEGRILDGRNRYRACREAGVEPRFVTWQGEGSAAELSLSLNLRRRHLDESQRAMVAARLAKLLQFQRPARGANLHHAKSLRSHDQAATAVNVSRRSLMHASKILNDGCPELIAAVEGGKVAVSTAARLAALSKEEQARVAAGGAQEITRRLRDMRPGGKAEPGPSFGVVVAKSPSAPVGVILLWVAASGLEGAVEALKKRGYRGGSKNDGNCSDK